MRLKWGAILTDAWLAGRTRLLITWRASIALQAGHALLAGALASGVVADLSERADWMAIAG